jgi:hypothetical protein
MPYTQDVNIALAPELAENTNYFFNVIVRDLAGNKTEHAVLSAWTLPALQPKIDIDVMGSPIANGNMCDFPDTTTGTSGTPVMFTIKNTGPGVLDLKGTPYYVQVSGTHASDFSITQPSIGGISSGGSTSFTVTFTPSGEGPRIASLTITSDDADENPYTIDIIGSGAKPMIVMSGATSTISDIHEPVANTFTNNSNQFLLSLPVHPFQGTNLSDTAGTVSQFPPVPMPAGYSLFTETRVRLRPSTTRTTTHSTRLAISPTTHLLVRTRS